MLKKISAALTALVIAGTMMCGCSNKSSDNSSGASSSSSLTESKPAESQPDIASDGTTVPDPKLIVDGEEMDTDGLIVCTVDGVDVDFDTFRYYYYYSVNQLTQNYGATLDTIAQTDGGFEVLLENTIMNIKQEYVTYHISKENGIELTDEDNAYIDETYNTNLENSGSEEAFNQTLHDSYLTPELYRTMLELATLYTKCQDELFTNEGVYATSKEEFRKIVQDPAEYSCVRSILIPYSCKTEITDEDTAAEYDNYSLSEKYSAKQVAYAKLEDEEKETAKAAAKEQADAVLEKAKAGDDFEELIAEYNWDPGQDSYPDGYYLTPNSNYVQEYLDAAFAISEGEVSDLIENESYGWFVLKRMPIDMDYVEENIESMIQDYDLPKRQQLYTDIMDSMEVTYADFYDKLTIDSIT